MFRHQVTDEIELRLIEHCHAEEIFGVVDANRKYLRQWMPWLDHSKSSADITAYIETTLRQYAEGKGFQAGIWVGSRFCGTIGHHPINWEHRSTALGYWLDADYQGRGIVTKCCRAIVDDAFARLKLHRVVIRVAVENRRSRAIPERLGFSLEGIARHGQWLYDRFLDIAIYSMLETEWKS